MKKGELTTSTIVGIILLLLGFAIIGYFIYGQLSWKGIIDKEACHESVVLRATVPTLVEGFVPLKCRTEKICITSKNFGGKCPDFENIKGITYVKVKNIGGVEKAIADNTIDCWSMMGEGKVSIFSQYFAKTYSFGVIYPTCVICSRIAFDVNSLSKSKINLSEMNVINYMQTHEAFDKGVSYADYLAGENGKIAIGGIEGKLELPKMEEVVINGTKTIIIPNESDKVEVEMMNKSELLNEIQSQKSNYSLQTKELSILFMQISSPKHGESAMNVAKLVGATGATAGVGASTLVGGTRVLKGVGNVLKLCAKHPAAAIACVAIPLILGGIQQGMVAYNRDISASKCGDISTGSEARDGCSVVRTVNYEEDSIKQYCSVIESIP